MTHPSTPPAALLALAATLFCACSSKAPVPLDALLEVAAQARAAEDWDSAREAYEQAFDAAEAAHDEAAMHSAHRGRLQALSASDPTAALADAQAWLAELGPAATVDLYGGLATDFKFTGATAEGAQLCDLGLAAFPGDVGLVNAKQRIKASLPTDPASH